jgi:hypothetical protein
MAFWLGWGLFSLVIPIALCVHAIRTGQQFFWIWIIIVFSPIGWAVYFFAVLLPDLMGGTRAKRMGMAARDALDPGREYRLAKAALDETPTVNNQMRLAAAAAHQGRWAEAEQLYGAAMHGIHADDPAILLGRANALLELGRAADAAPLVDKLVEEQGVARNPSTVLAQARVLESLGRFGEADEAYQFAAGRLPGLEALARYAAFLAATGRRQDAADNLAEIDRRLQRANPQFRREGRAWRELAANAMAKG